MCDQQSRMIAQPCMPSMFDWDLALSALISCSSHRPTAASQEGQFLRIHALDITSGAVCFEVTFLQFSPVLYMIRLITRQCPRSPA